MSESGPDALFVIIALVCVSSGVIFGGILGESEAGTIGMVIGGMAGGFLGFLVTYLISFVFALGLAAMIVFGPLALIIVVAYFLLKRVEAF